MIKIKVCPICGQEFEVDTSSPRDNCRKYCFECSPAGRKADYTPLLHAMRRQAIKIKGGACQKCGYNKCEDALCFHHRDPSQKKFTLSTSSVAHSWEDFLKEAEKCDLLCANCHLEEHKRLREEKAGGQKHVSL